MPEPQPEADDAYLVARARDGYLGAYDLLVARHSAMAYRVALRLAGDHHDAQDIAQEALVAAWQNLGRFRGESSFTSWLYRIVTRQALTKITRRRAAGSLDLLGDIPDPAAWPRGPRRAQRCRRRGHRRTGHAAPHPADRRGPASPRGPSCAEVAQVTRSTVPAVRSHLFRARRTLGTRLSEWR